jgi:hypothetical protein
VMALLGALLWCLLLLWFTGSKLGFALGVL